MNLGMGTLKAYKDALRNEKSDCLISENDVSSKRCNSDVEIFDGNFNSDASIVNEDDGDGCEKHKLPESLSLQSGEYENEYSEIKSDIGFVVGYRCHVCNLPMSSKEAWNSHLVVHFTQKCPFCSYRSRSVSAIGKHISLYHTLKAPETWSRDGKLGRSIRLTKDLNTLLKNESVQCNSVQNIMLFACRKCPYTTTTLDLYEQHVSRNHDKEKLYWCEQCNYRCLFKSGLKCHMMIHSSIYPYRCLDCKFASKYKSTLHKHLRECMGHRAAPMMIFPEDLLQENQFKIEPKRHPSEKKKSSIIKNIIKFPWFKVDIRNEGNVQIATLYPFMKSVNRYLPSNVETNDKEAIHRNHGNSRNIEVMAGKMFGVKQFNKIRISNSAIISVS